MAVRVPVKRGHDDDGVALGSGESLEVRLQGFKIRVQAVLGRGQERHLEVGPLGLLLLTLLTALLLITLLLLSLGLLLYLLLWLLWLLLLHLCLHLLMLLDLLQVLLGYLCILHLRLRGQWRRQHLLMMNLLRHCGCNQTSPVVGLASLLKFCLDVS